MKTFILYLRSAVFHVLFVASTLLICFFLLPGVLLPRKKMMWIVWCFASTVFFLEKYIIGLTYEVRGKEYLPASGSYIVAAKHESSYETYKLFHLFGDPAIVLKKELLLIPLWGQFLAKVDPIAIDRSHGKESLNRIAEGARRVIGQGRVIVIFPQGTRVPPDATTKDYHYRIGIARLAEETSVPIIPMALNSGMFAPKGSFLIRPGKVIFEFLPPMERKDSPKEFLKDLEARLEPASAKLAAEARA